MARTRDWNDVFDLALARAGGGSNQTEKDRLKLFLNSAARTISDYSPYWDCLLQLQERSVVNGVVPLSEDSYEVKGAGETDANGLYSVGEDFNGYPTYRKLRSGGNVAYSISAQQTPALETWLIHPGSPEDFVFGATKQYYSAGPALLSPTPPIDGWAPSTDGSEPEPTLRKLDDIDEAITIWNGPVFQGSSENNTTPSVASVQKWYQDASGIRLTNPNTDTVFVGFKALNTDKYGDGTGGTVSDVPEEWADYMSYAAARMLQTAQRSAGDFVGISLREVDEQLNNALMRVSRNRAMSALKDNLETYYNYDISTL